MCTKEASQLGLFIAAKHHPVTQQRPKQRLIKGLVQDEDRRPKNEDPFKVVLKSLENSSNMILDRSRIGERQNLRLSSNLTRVFVLYKTPPKVQNEDPLKSALKLLKNSSNIVLFYIVQS